MTEALRSVDPRTGEATGEPVPVTSPADVDRAAERAAEAAPAYAALPLTTRAALLRGVSAALGAHADEIIALADSETALGTARLTGELGRARVQFEIFADAVESGDFLEIIIDKADPDALPTPRPDLRRMLVPLGPVAVYAASNFPLAFSVPGGDTASALAAGCPVIVKAHESHPRTSLLCARLITEALAEGGAPDGVFSVVFGFEAGTALVRHPAVTAAGFTGSLHGGRALHEIAAGRPEPIPFYGELGSVNPVIVTAAALAERGTAIAEGYIASMTLGAGQFCTKPGVLFLPEGHGLDDVLATAAAATTPHPLLHERIRDGYLAGVRALAELPGVRVLAAPGKGENGFSVRTGLFGVAEKYFRANTEVLLTECFGPASVIVEYAPESLEGLPSLIPGSLTATVHIGTDEDAAALVAGLARKVGRVVVNGWPTGVAVTAAQQHGGPWPAATTSQHTSVGETAMRRWLRPVSYQDTPQALLPEVLRDSAEGTLRRRVSESFGS